MPGFIDQYLVGLSFATDNASLAKFTGTLKLAESTVAGATSGMVAKLLKFQFAATGAFLAVGGGVIGYIDKLAMGDQQMRLFAQRSMMTLQQARTIQTSLSVLGVSLEDVSWDKELHGRFMALIDDQHELAKTLGPAYETQMRQVRDVQFQLQRLEVKGEYFGMKFVGDLLKKLGIGDGSIEGSLKQLNDYVFAHIPEWSDTLSTKFVPVLHDAWEILKLMGVVAKDVGLEFTNLVGVFSGDTSIQGSTFDFKKFADALGIVAHWLAEIVETMLKVERVAVRFAPVIAGITGGAAVGGATGATVGLLGGPLGFVGGGATGSAIGGVVGGIGGLGVMLKEESGRYAGNPTASVSGSLGGGGSIADQARRAAQLISAKVGVAPDLLWAEWAHETGNFTNRGAKSLNNLAGIRLPGSKEYQNFASIDDFANREAQVLSLHRYDGLRGAKNGTDFAHVLKRGGYYEGPEDVYARQIDYFRRQYSQGGVGGGTTQTVGSISVHINNPGASAHEIQRSVAAGVRDGMGQQAQLDMLSLNGAY